MITWIILGSVFQFRYVNRGWALILDILRLNSWAFILASRICVIVTSFKIGIKTPSEMASKVHKEANIRNRYNQVPHLTQDTTQESDKRQ